ncbi:MAG: hypothetical protein ACPGYT_15125, partial [Nitrospirales bacterium]
KEYLKLQGLGENYLSPQGTLAHLDFDQGVSVFKPYQKEQRASGLKIPLSQVIFSGLSVKFSKNFKTQTYRNMGASEEMGIGTSLILFMMKVTDFIFRTNLANEPLFNGYIEGNTSGSKDHSQFPFGIFLKVHYVGPHWGQYEEVDGTIWEISHISLTEVNWVEVLDESTN